MRMIKLNALGGETYVNVDKIEVITAQGELTVIALTNGNNDNYFRVNKTPEEIIELIKNAKEI